MFARAATGTVIGVDPHEVVIEANPGKGLPGVALIGLARGAVKESMVRVRAAIGAAGYQLGTHRLVVNMLPAELPKDGSALDLAVAVVLLASVGRLPLEALHRRRFFGELSLGGGVEAVGGAVGMADLARRCGDRELFVPAANAHEAALIPGIAVIGVESLAQLVAHLMGTRVLSPAKPTLSIGQTNDACMAEIRGQQRAKRALEIAAAGAHNLLLVGPPGSGKTMLARRLPGLLPPLEAEECIEVTRIYSAAGRVVSRDVMRQRPFRAPHHTASEPALCGGGGTPRPGEITLAHRGVLFLDELPEFSRRALESLREPLEEGTIQVARAGWSCLFPADVLLVAAMNPCPCGRYRGDQTRRVGEQGVDDAPSWGPEPSPGPGRPVCMCTFEQVMRYRRRISGPLLDRIDLHVLVDAVPYRDYAHAGSGETSAEVKQRVSAARSQQQARMGPGRTNAQLRQPELREHVPLDDSMLGLIEQATDSMGLSARAIERCLKVARTIADLAGESAVAAAHIAEAIDFRLLDRGG